MKGENLLAISERSTKILLEGDMRGVFAIVLVVKDTRVEDRVEAVWIYLSKMMIHSFLLILRMFELIQRFNLSKC